MDLARGALALSCESMLLALPFAVAAMLSACGTWVASTSAPDPPHDQAVATASSNGMVKSDFKAFNAVHSTP
jgi:hypothetical protein